MAMSCETNALRAEDVKKVRVLYNYEYLDDNEKVWMQEGEIFDLLNSSGTEWWQVCRPQKPELTFYVPNTYVEILEEGNVIMGSECSPSNQGYDGTLVIRPQSKIEQQNNDAVNNNIAEMSTFKSPSSMEIKVDNDSDDNDYVNSANYQKKEEQNGDKDTFDVKYVHPATRPDSLDDGGDYANLEDFRALAGMPPQQPSPQSPDSDYANLQDLNLKEPSPPSLDSCEFKMPLGDGWDVFLDPVSNRMVYVHRQTSQTQWKPPRGQYHKEMTAKLQRSRSSGEYDEAVLDLDLDLFEGTQLSQPEHKHLGQVQVLQKVHRKQRPKSKSLDCGIPTIHLPVNVPQGWKQVTDENGIETFVNEISQEKWMRTADSRGRAYFYRQGSQGPESVWQLPSRETSAPSSPQSKSPDADTRTNIFVNPPVAPKGPVGPSGPARAQVSDRFAKSRSVMIENLQFTAPSISTGQPPPKSATLPTNFNTPFTETEPIEGTLNKCKIVNGKKVSKKWSYSFVKLHGSNLVFYKDQKSAQAKPNQPHGKYDEMVPLGTCTVEKNPKEYTSKKNVILLMSPDCQLLLQAEDERRLNEWFLKIHMKIEELGGNPTKAMAELTPPSPGATGVDRKPSFKGKHKRSPSEAGNLEKKGKIQEILTKFISVRSDKKELVKKGIYKEAVFGADLKTICEREKSKVPVFVQNCVTSIEKHGLDHEGIYRIGGNISTIQKLRCIVDQGETYDLDNTELWDINILTGSLKLFFRELKEPLFTYALFDKFLKGFLKENAVERLKAIKATIKELPTHNYETIKFLFKHLTAVVENSVENKMQAHQLAIVFGPTLIWPEKQTHHLATSMVYQSRIVEFILLEYHNIFR